MVSTSTQSADDGSVVPPPLHEGRVRYGAVHGKRLVRPLHMIRPAVFWPRELGRQQEGVEGVPVGLEGPSVRGAWDPVTREGRLFKLQARRAGGQNDVYFYNATRDTVFTISYDFDADSVVTPGGPSVTGSGQSWKTLLGPGNTLLFVSGTITGCRLQLHQQPATPSDGDISRSTERAQADMHNLRRAAEGADTPLDAPLQLLQLSVPYIDLSFPPDQASLQLSHRIQWCRPSAFLSPEAAARAGVLVSDIHPNDVDQGRLGDSWLASALAAIAEDPPLVHNLFLATRSHMQARQRGAYVVHLCTHGWFQQLVVDDYLPVCGREPAFIHNIHSPYELWAALVEKAFAKTRRSYAAIHSGDVLEALQDLTGFPGQRVDWNDSQTFHVLDRGLRQGAMVVLRAPAHGDAQRYEKAGLLNGYSYVLLDTVQVKGLQLCRVRNAWGDATQWHGPWGYNSQRWRERPEITSVCGQPRADGTMWIEWSEVKRWFEGAGVLHTVPTWHDVRMATEFREGTPAHLLEVWTDSTSEALIGVHQRGDQAPAALLITVVSPKAGGGWVVRPVGQSHNGKYHRGRDTYLPFRFEASESGQKKPHYIVWRIKGGASRTVVVSLHAEYLFATLVAKQPNPEVLVPLGFSQATNSFNPSACRRLKAAFQLNRLHTATTDSITMRDMPPPPKIG